MAVEKIYSAFISSEFNSLKDERRIVIDTLLDHRVLPICMEHFTVASSEKFDALAELIDASDFFILLLGGQYGSCDDDGVSWTEKEYDYALKKNKRIIAIICDELVATMNKDPNTLTEEEKKQIRFKDKIGFARKVSEKLDVKDITHQALATNLSKCPGWVRAENTALDPDALKEWQEKNKVFDLAGRWYHMHLSDDDIEYIRVGTIDIMQEFTPGKYTELVMSGSNYSVLNYDKSKNELNVDMTKISRFDGEYKIKANGDIFGIFSAKRTFNNGSFNSQTIQRGTRRGIHDFKINLYADTTDSFEGEFHDEAPSPKVGIIYVYRSESERNQALLNMRRGIVKIIQGENEE